VAEAVRRAVAGIGPLRFRVERLGAFQSTAKATVVWAGVEDAGRALTTLAAALERELVPLGYPAETRPFHPHVTLARLREPASVDSVLLPFAEQVFSETRCDSVTLFESLTKPSGSEYVQVLRAPLSAAISPLQRQTDPVQTAPLDASSGSDDGWDKR
jgi:2'-5' RNA ligase